MTLNILVTDPSTGYAAKVKDGEEENALVVATRPLKKFTASSKAFFNSTYGIDMNQNITFAGTPDKIHNGIDDILWTATAIRGIWDFNNSTQQYTGSYSIDATNTANADIVQFTKGSNVDLSGHTAITGWIYITNWYAVPNKNIIIYGWNTTTGLMVGISVNINHYITPTNLNSWQKFAIPLPDLNLETSIIDAVRIEIEGNEPAFYLDDFQLEETGEPVEFRIQPDTGTWFHIVSFVLIFSDEYDSTLANSAIPKIPHTGWLGVSTLETGLVYRRYKDGKIIQTGRLRDMKDFLVNPFVNMTFGTDGTDTWVRLEMQRDAIAELIPQTLKSEKGDYWSLTLSEDLSGLKEFRGYVHGMTEERSLGGAGDVIHQH